MCSIWIQGSTYANRSLLLTISLKPALFPMDQNHQLVLVEGAMISEPTRYQHLVGRFIYLRVTSPELP